MDPRLLRYYNQELHHLREMGGEFARQFPKIASRLTMDGMAVADPYVERLLEGFAFLAGRVQLKIDAEFPRFTQRLLEILYPNFLAPTPAMLIAQFQADLSDGNLARGYPIPRGSQLRDLPAKSGGATTCQFRTAHDTTLWPIEIVSAEYFSFAPDLPLAALSVGRKIKGGVRLRLKTTAGLHFNQLAAKSLRFFLTGSDEVSYKLYELILGSSLGVLLCPPGRSDVSKHLLAPEAIQAVGFGDNESLLPATIRRFQGYRLLQEYFSFPQRFLFFDIGGLDAAFQRELGAELELVILLGRGDATLESVFDRDNIALNCVPAINLFERRCDRIHVNDNAAEYHVIPDRTRPMDFEVYEIASVTGFGVGAGSEQPFLPFYAAFHTETAEHTAYYTLQREPRLLSATQKRVGPRSPYVGSEVFISLTDSREAPFSGDLRQLAVTALCTNRDLPLHMVMNAGATDLSLEIAAPVTGVKIVKGPSRPNSAVRTGDIAWKFVNQLALNYLSLVDTDEQEGAAALRELLQLYVGDGEISMSKQIEGMRSVKTRPTVRRLPVPGPIAFGRGLEIELEVDEMAFQGVSAFLFGSVMEHFLNRHVSINSFTETVLRSQSRGEIMRWRPRCGDRPIL